VNLVSKVPRENRELRVTQDMMVLLESLARRDPLVISEKTEKRERKAL